MHRVRCPNLYQKVSLLNIFVLPKLRFVCGALEANIEIVSRAMRAFLWNGSGGFRIPLEQLVLPRHRGLNLHLPSAKPKSLLSSRYVIQQRSLRVGTQHIIHVGNPPNIQLSLLKNSNSTISLHTRINDNYHFSKIYLPNTHQKTTWNENSNRATDAKLEEDLVQHWQSSTDIAAEIDVVPFGPQ